MQKFQQLQELYYRGALKKGSPEWREYFALKYGIEGEAQANEYLKRHLPKNIKLIHNLNLDIAGKTQIDYLILARHLWWVIEIKNYNGVLKYENQQATLRGEAFHNDPFAAMRRRMTLVKELSQQTQRSLNVVGTFISIHPEGEVIWDSQEAFDIVMRHQLNRYLVQKIQDCNLNQADYVQADMDLINQVVNQEFACVDDISQETWQALRRGLRCNRCGSFNLEIENRRLTCRDCGESSSKNQAIQIAMDQYHALYPSRPKVSVQTLYSFIDCQISRKTLFYALKKA
ncbi:nuclease-related domain-containing protein [Facklamia hominis]|uniref:nuclease-related domain-containing protein n=1 Tax=Facklamia hominis TaxID=178214 RepID=UPI0028891CDE|nr:nuclease-related domain-containing protein [Facklamia hominis]